MKYLLIFSLLASPISAQQMNIKDAVASGNTACITEDQIALWNDNEETPLTFAAKNSEASVETLISMKCDLNKKNSAGETPLAAACISKKWKCARLLLSSGANPNLRDNHDKTPLFYAAQEDIETVRMIVSKKGNVNSSDNPLCAAARSGKRDIVEFLFKSGGNIYKNRSLMHAAAKGNADTVWFLLQKKISPTAKDAYGATPLHYAAEEGKRDTAAAFLTRKAKIDALDADGNTPMMRYLAVKKENAKVEYLQFLSQWGAKFSLKNYKAQSAIVIACPQKDILRYLVNKGADINSGDSLGNTGIHRAVIDNNSEAFELFRSLGAGINVRNRSGATPFDIALRNDNISMAIRIMKEGGRKGLSSENAYQKLLLKAISAGDIDAVNYVSKYLSGREGITDESLRCAIFQPDFSVLSAVASAKFAIRPEAVGKKFEILFKESDPFFAFAYSAKTYSAADIEQSSAFFGKAPSELIQIFSKARGIDSCGTNKITPLMLVAANGNPERIKLLLSFGADISRKDFLGMNALSHAAASGNNDTLRELLENKADASRTDHDKWTPLMHAVNAGNIDGVKILLKNGSAINTSAYDGMTALMIASANRNYEMISLLENAGAKHSRGETSLIKSHRLIKAAENGNFYEIESLLPVVSNIDFCDKRGRTALFAAAEMGKESIVKILLDKNASANVKSRNGKTALHASIENGHAKITEMLLQNGADSDIYDSDGKTPLIKAIERNSFDEVAFLVNAGANINRKSADGIPALFYLLSEKQNIDYINYLICRGADLNQRDPQGRTVLMLACEKGLVKIAEFLMKTGADPKARDNKGMSAIDHAVKNNYTDIVKFLIDGGFSRSASAFALLGDKSIKDHNYNEAISFYSKAIREDYTINVYANMGIAFYKLRGNSIAQRCFAIAIQKDPSDPAAYYNLAVISAAAKDRSIPLKKLEEALQRGYRDYDAISSEPAFFKLKKDPRFSELIKRYLEIQ